VHIGRRQSNREGKEVEKLAHYAEMGVAYAIIYDPDTLLSAVLPSTKRPRPVRPWVAMIMASAWN
jgi:hypothetical protein